MPRLPSSASRFHRGRDASGLRALLGPAVLAYVIGLLFFGIGAGLQPATGEVLRVEVESRTPVLDGASFGAYGSYELIRGRIYFAFDPADPANDAIVDLDRAPRDSLGRVQAWTTFAVLQPTNDEKRRGLALVEVSNRGGTFSMAYFNRATADLAADDPDAFGDGLLMREGLTVIWIGWQWDVPRGEDRLRLRVPTARHDDGEPIFGRVRSDWVVEEATDVLALGHRDHFAYRAADFDHPDNVLTVRDGRTAPRRVVPRDDWRFARRDSTGAVVPDSTHIFLDGGFDAGKIYECVYRSKNPRVVGLGLAAIRDVISYAKYDPDTLFPVDRGIAVGVSQTGRFLRHFLYQGFNTDEAGRRAYDGIVSYTAGAGRGSFNHRFAQPSRDAHRYSAFFYPTDLFPFTSRTQFDGDLWRSDGLLNRQREEHRPKTFQINTGYEYWGRGASLIHTTPDGTQDVAPADTERIYHIASAQHFPWRFPPPEENRLRGSAADEADLYRGNPLDQSTVYRALLIQMVAWVDRGTEPPPSTIPRRVDGTLAPIDSVDFPGIPGVAFPDVIHHAYRTDYGPRWKTGGIVDRQPPKIGDPYPSLVSRVDSIGNERAGIETVGVRVPLATYMPWNLRIGLPGQTDELTDFYGSFAPLPRTDSARAATGDPRPSIESLYPSRDAYRSRVRTAADRLIERGFLLTDDRERVLQRAAEVWEWVME